MDKIPTLFMRDLENKSLVTPEVNPQAAWLLTEPATATVKRDGTNICLSVGGGEVLYVHKRRNPTKKQKAAGMQPYYVPADREDPADKHIFAAVDNTNVSWWPNGDWPCEALGPKIQGGIESDFPYLYPFSLYPDTLDENPASWVPQTNLFDTVRGCLERHPIEGIVWHSADGKMVKIKRRDFGLPWPVM